METISTVITHLISRAVYPASEHKTAAWIAERSAVSSLVFGKHQSISYQRLYRISDKLYEAKEGLEQHLYTTTKSIFKLQDKIILYDLPNTYFEGRKMNSNLAQFGRSKEKRSDAKLVSLAVVVNTDGFVKNSKIYEGNIGEPGTLGATVDSLAPYGTPGTKKPILVIDAGIASEENLIMLKGKGYDYLCVTRKKLRDYKIADKKSGMVIVKDKRKRKIALQRVTVVGNTDTFMYIRSEQKAVKEASMEAHFSGRFMIEI